MGEIELSAADDELVFGEDTGVRKADAKPAEKNAADTDLPKTLIPETSSEGIPVSSGDDFFDGIDNDSDAPENNSGLRTESAAAPVAPANPKMDEPARADSPVLSVKIKSAIEPERVVVERRAPPTPPPQQASSDSPVSAPAATVAPKSAADASISRQAPPVRADNDAAVPGAQSAQTAPQPRAAEPQSGTHLQSRLSLVSSERLVISTDIETKAKREAIELFEILLGSAVKGGASDLLLKQGQVPMFRWNGELYPSRNGPRIDGRFFMNLSAALLSSSNCERLNNMVDVDFSYQSVRGGRVRVNIFHQRGDLSLVARLIPSEIPTFEKLGMGKSIRNLAEQKRGLILVTGATGSGKSTTLAAMLDFINSTRTSHVITIEDPIEFVHSDKRSMFNQRELGLDTPTYAQALRSALRQAPDVILVGELRDSETVEVALQAAETGHLVLSTLHTNDAADSLLRILGMMGQEKESIVRAQLADSLRAVVSQRLIKRKDSGRVAAQEVMVNTATIREKLLKGGHPSLVRDVIAQGGHSGMQSFDQHLAHLVQSDVIEYDEALANATNRDDFALRYNGVGDGREAS